jgi:hypothetical protein
VTPKKAHSFLLPACLQLFPERFNTPEARAMLLAIALQESDFRHRQQLIGFHRNWWESLKGPAAGFWQFERIGIRGVLEHRTTGPMARTVLQTLGYPDDVETIHKAIIHNDILAVCLARLALFRVPEQLPGPDDAAEGWRQYVWAWRPGKPHPDRWAERYTLAWEIVTRAGH